MGILLLKILNFNLILLKDDVVKAIQFLSDEVKFPRCPHQRHHDASLLGVDISVHSQACVPPLAFCLSQLGLSGA